MKKATITGETVKKYLEIYPKIPALTLAKKIYAENSEIFKNVEGVRDIIRYYLGQKGERSGREVTDKRFFRESRDTNPFKLPESFSEKWDPYKIPERDNRILVISDLHFPYHDVIAITSMIDHAIKRGVNTILINGDLIDFYHGSRFMNDPRKRHMNDEIWDVVEFLNVLQFHFPDVQIIFKLGNHEERLENYLKVKAPELLNMEEFKLSSILKIRGVENITYVEKQIIYAGRLPILHGHEYGGYGVGGVNPARGLSLKSFSSSLVGHSHRTSSHSERDINDKVMSWFSTGCLCGLHPEYALLNKWNHGFCYIETDGQEFAVSNHKIHKGKVYTE